MSASPDFDTQAAWLRRFTADAESNLNAFAQRLREAMPDRVTLLESKGLFARKATLTGLAVRMDEHVYTLKIDHGRLKASIAMEVRGITLNTREVDPGTWFAQLAQETEKASAHARSLSQSISAFMAS
ncbi:hypothetical protein AruPA_04785 [Acidiphilium sp. PA]|uniref:hypothetical protein n=1 Tax=Acidiphilium sp. PA TaxID=2871705 RepID=UPI002243D8D2|nr:hypothetical protein [Acidiphilium sp. PA]MCW8306342.1 hypothetical protein [Acidiphilium sp. PA]